MMVHKIIDLHIFCVFVLMIMFIYIRSNKERSLSPKIFSLILSFLTFTLLTEAGAWAISPYYPKFGYWLYHLSLSTSSFQSVAWVAYFDYKIYADTSALKRRVMNYALAPLAILMVMVYNIIEPGFVFALDTSGNVLWGWGSWLPPVIVYIMVAYALMVFWKNKQMIEGRITQVLLIFILAPIGGGFFQQFIEGVPLNWSLYTLALLMTFISIEMSELYKDELTNMPTRRQLEVRLAFKLKNDAPFFVVMMDLDNFKVINDTFGHLKGDQILQVFADILITSINPEDIACRVGGDEFMVIVETSEDHVMLEVIERILKRIEHFNIKEPDVNLAMSYGIEKVLKPSDYTLDELLHKTDTKMYNNKKRRKQEKNKHLQV